LLLLAPIQKGDFMKNLLLRLVGALLLLSALSGCAAIQRESALEWLQRQPWTSDSPT
jgi:hypothetical protein